MAYLIAPQSARKNNYDDDGYDRDNINNDNDNNNNNNNNDSLQSSTTREPCVWVLYQGPDGCVSLSQTYSLAHIQSQKAGSDQRAAAARSRRQQQRLQLKQDAWFSGSMDQYRAAQSKAHKKLLSVDPEWDPSRRYKYIYTYTYYLFFFFFFFFVLICIDLH